jgi:uncharacterized protein
MESVVTDDTTLEHGLNFECTRCGNCCRQEPGHVFLSALDLRRLAVCLDMSDEEFFVEYCEVVDLHLAERVSLIAEDNGDCVFLGEDGCDVYEHRPLQCRTYPFWATHLIDRASWHKAGETCPGIDAGRLWTQREIQDLVELREQEPLLDVRDEDSSAGDEDSSAGDAN